MGGCFAPTDPPKIASHDAVGLPYEHWEARPLKLRFLGCVVPKSLSDICVPGADVKASEVAKRLDFDLQSYGPQAASTIRSVAAGALACSALLKAVSG